MIKKINRLLPIFSPKADKEFYETKHPLRHLESQIKLAQPGDPNWRNKLSENPEYKPKFPGDFKYRLYEAIKWLAEYSTQVNDPTNNENIITKKVESFKREIIDIYNARTNSLGVGNQFLEHTLEYASFLKHQGVSQTRVNCVLDLASLYAQDSIRELNIGSIDTMENLQKIIMNLTKNSPIKDKKRFMDTHLDNAQRFIHMGADLEKITYDLNLASLCLKECKGELPYKGDEPHEPGTLRNYARRIHELRKTA